MMIIILILILIIIICFLFFYRKEYTILDKLNFDVNNILNHSGLNIVVRIMESDKISYWEDNKIFIVRKKGLHYYNYDTLLYICLVQASKMIDVAKNSKSILKLLENSAKKLGINCTKTLDYPIF